MSFSFFSFAAIEDNAVTINQVHTLSQIPINQPEQTLFLFDIDDTLIETGHMVGSSAWRKYLLSTAQQIDDTKNWHDYFSLYLAINYPVAAVESITSAFIKEIQDKGHVVCGFTRRERGIWYDTPYEKVDDLTVNQLLLVQVDFDNGALEKAYPELGKNNEYYKGIFFVNQDPKGAYLAHILNTTTLVPKHVVFVDDKFSQVESVDQVLIQLDVDHTCYYYTALDYKNEGFDPLLANIQLYYFYLSEGDSVLTDDEAAEIARANPGITAEEYLKAVIELAKKRPD